MSNMTLALQWTLEQLEDGKEWLDVAWQATEKFNVSYEDLSNEYDNLT